MKDQNSIIFQIGSPLVKEVYENNPNYLIEYDNTQLNITCAIYFCSNEIYYPNTEESFRDNILEKNKYEWYNTRIPNTYKHIFIRDIKKQWYLTGINSTINSPQLLLEFLKNETIGCSITLVGSSAGGFASVLYGSLLNADKVYSFNGQFEIYSLLEKSSPIIDPLLFKFRTDNEKRPFFDTKPYLNTKTKVFYFNSINSSWDGEQFNHIKDEKIYTISFVTKHHGVPFPKNCLPDVLKLKTIELISKSRRQQHPLLFSIELIGYVSTFKGIFYQILKRIKRR